MRPFQCEYGLPRVIDGDNSGRRRDYNSSGGRRSSDRQRSNVASTQSSCEWNSADRRVKVSCSRFNDAASSDDKPSIHGSEFSERLNKVWVVNAARILSVPLHRI